MTRREPTGKLLVDGALVHPAAGGVLPVTDPSTGATAREVALGGVVDVAAAVSAARQAFDAGPWPRLSPGQRGAILLHLADLVDAHTASFTDLVVSEVGTVRRTAELGQVRRPLDHYRDMVERGVRGLDQPLADLAGPPVTRQCIVREPRGVVAAITPWNAPHLVNLWKVAPALATGNTMVLKPALEAPGCALLLGELAHEAGIPAGVLNVVTGDAEVGQALVADHRVDMIAFTGSTATGRAIARTAAERLTHTVLELGGKSALLALPDADIGSLVATAMRFVTLSGQGCGLLTRILVPEALHDAVVAGFVDAFARVKVGHAEDPAAVMGPVISAAARDRIEAVVAHAVVAGATVAAGGGRPEVDADGFYLAPTLLTDVDNSMTVAREEVFGPVICVIGYSGDPEEGVAIANDSDYGLLAAVWTADVARGRALAQRIRAGQVRVNAVASTTEGPFGGYKQSGVGRECGDLGVAEYTEVKYLAWPAASR